MFSKNLDDSKSAISKDINDAIVDIDTNARGSDKKVQSYSQRKRYQYSDEKTEEKTIVTTEKDGVKKTVETTKFSLEHHEMNKVPQSARYQSKKIVTSNTGQTSHRDYDKIVTEDFTNKNSRFRQDSDQFEGDDIDTEFQDEVLPLPQAKPLKAQIQPQQPQIQEMDHPHEFNMAPGQHFQQDFYYEDVEEEEP